MRKLPGSLALGLGMLAGSAHADVAKFYYGLGLADGQVQVDDTDSEKSLSTVNGTFGVQLLDFIGLELQAGFASDEIDSILNDSLVNYQAAMVRLGYRWDRVGVYLLGGQARLDIDDRLNDSDAGTAFGGGINLFGNETTALNLNYIDFDDGAFSATTIGFQHYFGGFR